MKAAVVRDFKQGPQYEKNFSEPNVDENQVMIDVTASALSNRARGDATGTHYAAEGILPMVPGVDGVGLLPTGEKAFFVGNGGFAERVAIKKGHWVGVPKQLDDQKIAGMMNPALSSWMALKYRAHFQKGQRVMILGATGNAGMLAVQIAQRMGATEIISVGRNQDKLEALLDLGATATIRLTDDVKAYQDQLAAAGRQVDVVLDYLWGDITANAMKAIIPNRTHDEQELKWVEIGSIAGQAAPIPGAAFRAVKLQLIGSGQGSIGVKDMIQSFNEIIAAEVSQPFAFTVKTVGLSEIEKYWTIPSSERLVFVPTH